MIPEIHPPLSPLTGRRYLITVHGRRSPNSDPQTQIISGALNAVPEDLNLYEAAGGLLLHAVEEAELAYPEAICITIHPAQRKEAEPA